MSIWDDIANLKEKEMTELNYSTTVSNLRATLVNHDTLPTEWPVGQELVLLLELNSDETDVGQDINTSILSASSEYGNIRFTNYVEYGEGVSEVSENNNTSVYVIFTPSQEGTLTSLSVTATPESGDPATVEVNFDNPISLRNKTEGDFDINTITIQPADDESNKYHITPVFVPSPPYSDIRLYAEVDGGNKREMSSYLEIDPQEHISKSEITVVIHAKADKRGKNYRKFTKKEFIIDTTNAWKLKGAEVASGEEEEEVSSASARRITADDIRDSFDTLFGNVPNTEGGTISVNEGESFSVGVTPTNAEGYDYSHLKYAVYRNDHEMGTAVNYTVTSATAEDAGNWRIDISDDAGISKTISWTVSVTPKVTTLPPITNEDLVNSFTDFFDFVGIVDNEVKRVDEGSNLEVGVWKLRESTRDYSNIQVSITHAGQPKASDLTYYIQSIETADAGLWDIHVYTTDEPSQGKHVTFTLNVTPISRPEPPADTSSEEPSPTIPGGETSTDTEGTREEEGTREDSSSDTRNDTESTSGSDSTDSGDNSRTEDGPSTVDTGMTGGDESTPAVPPSTGTPHAVNLSQTNLGIVHEGDQIDLTAEGFREGSQLQWYHVDAHNNFVAIDGQVTARLTLTVTPEYNHSFVLRAISGGSIADSSPAVMTRFVPNTPAVNMANTSTIVVDEHGSFDLSVQVIPFDKYTNITWKYIPENGIGDPVERTIFGGQRDININPASLADAGEYYAEVSRLGHVVRSESRRVVVNRVQEAIKVDIRLSKQDNVNEPVGGTFTIHADITNYNETMLLQWYHRRGGMTQLIEGANAQVLMIPDLTTGHSGHYYIRVTQGNYITESDAVYLTVVELPNAGSPDIIEDTDTKTLTDEEKLRARKYPEGVGVLAISIDDYCQAMRQGNVLTPKEGARRQIVLYRDILRILNLEDIDTYMYAMDMLVDHFWAYRESVFRMEQRFRFLEFVGNDYMTKDDKEAFMALITVFVTMADPVNNVAISLNEVADIMRDDLAFSRLSEYFARKVRSQRQAIIQESGL